MGTSQDKKPILKHWLCAIRWGGHTLISLYISVLSGIVVALQYNSNEPFYSTATIELVAPFGWFWRALHYYSSQAFFLLLLSHCCIILWQNDAKFKRTAWIRLCSSIPVALLLLFTGYILRADATGEAAGAIAEHITLSIPLLGGPLNHILFDINSSGLTKVYTNHLIGLMVLGGFCVWPHLRRYTAKPLHHIPIILIIIVLSITLSTPVEPERIGLLHIAGPWFFLGLQELLRSIPPFWAGVVIPGSVLVALLFLPRADNPRTRCLWFLVFWLILYTGLSCLSYSRVHSNEEPLHIQPPAQTTPLETIPDNMK